MTDETTARARILLVEDEPSLLLTLGDRLRSEGYGVDSAEDGESALEQATEAQYDLVLEQADFDAWLARLESAELFAFDTETTSLDYMQADIVGVSFATERGVAAYVPVAHSYPCAPAQLDRDTVLAALKPILEDPARPRSVRT